MHEPVKTYLLRKSVCIQEIEEITLRTDNSHFRMPNAHEQNYMTQSQNVPQLEEEAVNWYFYRVVYQSVIKFTIKFSMQR